MTTANINITKVLHKRGNTLQNNNYTGVLGEITIDTQVKTIRIHDGLLQGGYPITSGGGGTYGNLDVAAYLQTDPTITSIQTGLNDLLTVSNIDPGTADETLWFNTDDGRLYVKELGLWVDANPAVLPSPSYIYSQLQDVVGNIIPNEDSIYSLGSETAQWKDLWVSNATIYLDKVPLSSDVGGNLTYNGNPLVSYVDGNLVVGGTVVSGGAGNPFNQNLNTYDAVSFNGMTSSLAFIGQINGTNYPGNYLQIQTNGTHNFNFGSDATLGLPGGSSLRPNGSGIDLRAGSEGYSQLQNNNTNQVIGVDDTEAYIYTYDISTGSKSWTFDKAGNLTLPSQSILGDTFGDGGITLRSPQAKYSELGTFDGNVFIWASDAGYEGVGTEAAAYVVTRYNTISENRWQFGADGNLTVPGAIQSNSGRLTFTSQTASPDHAWVIDDGYFGPSTSALVAPLSDQQHIGALVFPGSTGIGEIAYVGPIESPFDNSLVVGTSGNLVIRTDAFNLWQFKDDGRLIFPDGNAQITAYAIGGVDTQVQFNSNGVLAGHSNFTFDVGTDTLQVPGNLIVDNIFSVDSSTVHVHDNLETFGTFTAQGIYLTDGGSFISSDGNTASYTAHTNFELVANSTAWLFGANGNITFPDTTTQTTAWTGQLSINELTDVDTATSPPSIGDALKWDGFNWIPGPTGSGGGGIALTDLHAANLTPYNSGYLAYNSVSGTFSYAPPDLSGYALNANVTAANIIIDSIDANLGAYQTWANGNLSTQTINFNTLDSNVGNFYTWANANFATGSTYSNTNVAAYLTSQSIAAQIQSDWNQVTTSNVAYIKNKPDLSVYATTSALQTLDSNIGGYQIWSNSNSASQQTSINSINANLGAYQIWANANVSSLQNQITGANTSIQILNANVGSYQLYANTTTYSNANVIANLQNLTTNVTTTANVSAGNLIASGNLYTTGGILRTTATTANVFNSTATTVYIAGAATIGTYIGNASGLTQLYGNVQGSTNGFAIGYLDIPQVTFSASTTLALSDAGKHYYSTSSSALTLTIPTNTSVSFNTGAAINIVNQGTGTITVAGASGVTLYLAGNSTSGANSRTISSYGVATVQKVATNTWFIVGVGLT